MDDDFPIWDPDYAGSELDYDAMGFAERDLVDAQVTEDLRTLTTGLPARPGTRR